MPNAKELTGQKFSHLTVLRRVENDRFNKANWDCLCDCGKHIYVPTGALTTGNTKSCGCFSPSALKDLTGKKFGKLTVLKKESQVGSDYVKWVCLCDCGKISIVTRGNLLRSGGTSSCGCTGGYYKHGGKGTKLYSVWVHMKKRCQYEKAKCYKNYGGRGVSVCPEWENFDLFREWALASGFSPELTIERINNNGNYSPDNCKWATRSEQSRNKRTKEEVRRDDLIYYKTHDNESINHQSKGNRYMKESAQHG